VARRGEEDEPGAQCFMGEMQRALQVRGFSATLRSRPCRVFLELVGHAIELARDVLDLVLRIDPGAAAAARRARGPPRLPEACESGP
jgi:hypothetical protein